MIPGNFHRVVGAEAIGVFGDHSDFVVQTFDRRQAAVSPTNSATELELSMSQKKCHLESTFIY